MINPTSLIRPATVVGTLFSSVLLGVSLSPLSAIAIPVAQTPTQSPTMQDPAMPSAPTEQSPTQMEQPSATTDEAVVISSTGVRVKLSEIKVASLPRAPQNPCPSIYYENPYTQYVVVPQVCKANLITQQLDQAGLLQMFRDKANTGAMETSPTGSSTSTPSMSTPTMPR